MYLYTMFYTDTTGLSALWDGGILGIVDGMKVISQRRIVIGAFPLFLLGHRMPAIFLSFFFSFFFLLLSRFYFYFNSWCCYHKQW
ncbi:hypothetical protein LY78DRAFT_375814 [Colletotrichum sublineola]|nr:hypothetical protein LY78DRAFT_375814 [Colletotrichum sublineola]